MNPVHSEGLGNGLTLEIYYDQDYRDDILGDCMPPKITRTQSGIHSQDDLLNLPDLPRKASTYDHFLSLAGYGHSWGSLRQLVRDTRDTGWGVFEALLSEAKDAVTEAPKSELLNLLSDWYVEAGCQTLNTYAHGCAQGDWCEVVWVATPEWVEKVGIDPEHVQQALEGANRTLTHVNCGEVYGFILSKVTECDQGHEHYEQVDSAWGFVGDLDDVVKQIKEEYYHA